MILIDMNHLCIASYMKQSGGGAVTIDENLFRHIIYNELLSIRKKFKENPVLLCYDSANSWRKNVYKNYKTNRIKQRSESKAQWDSIFKLIEEVRKDLDRSFPYYVIKVDECEADDIIAVAATHFTLENHVIISPDKDFLQLHNYSGAFTTNQYNPITKSYIFTVDPERELLEHIFKGDSSDNIPNVFGDDNIFNTDVRQKPMTQKRINEFINNIQWSPGSKVVDNLATIGGPYAKNIARNAELIAFSKIPSRLHRKISNEIVQKLSAPANNKTKLMEHFINKDMKLLINHISEF